MNLSNRYWYFEVVAPFNGKIVATFPTKHAIGLLSNEGLELLVHVGLDTVKLNGDGFEIYVRVGDQVKKGTLLADAFLA